MPPGHDLELMLVNTVRKDLTSYSTARITLALESLVSSPSIDVIPAVQTRCVELLSHPSARIKILAMHAVHSLSRFSIDILREEKVESVLFKRLSDGEESVVRAALRICTLMVDSNLLERKAAIDPCIKLVLRLSEKRTGYSSSFKVTVLNTLSKLLVGEGVPSKIDCGKVLLSPLFVILRRAVKTNYQPLILECFRFFDLLPPSVIAQHIIMSTPPPQEKSTEQTAAPEKSLRHFEHPVTLIRHLLSSRIVNEHHLFLSCLVCLDPLLWAGTQTTEILLTSKDNEQTSSGKGEYHTMTIPAVLDQWEVERVLGSLDSDDDRIRALTLRILISLDISLVEGCYERALATLRSFTPSGASGSQPHKLDSLGMARAARRTLEIAFVICLAHEEGVEQGSVGRLFGRKVKDITDATGEEARVSGEIIEYVLFRVREESRSVQLSCVLGLFSSFELDESQKTPERRPINSTLLVIFLALSCELAPILSSSLSEVRKIIRHLANLLNAYQASMQEPLLLCMTRLIGLLTRDDLITSEIQDAFRIVHSLHESSLADRKKKLIRKCCTQFVEATVDPQTLHTLLDGNGHVPLPEFAVLLDSVNDSTLSGQERSSPSPSSLPTKHLSPNVMSPYSTSSSSQNKLRYEAYAPPSTNPVTMLGRNYSHSVSSATSRQSSKRSTSRVSSAKTDGSKAGSELTRTVTAGELTLAMASGKEPDRVSSREKGKIHDLGDTNGHFTSGAAPTKPAMNLMALDSPFLTEPLVDVDGPPTPPSPYVSANASLRTTPEPEPTFEEVWSALISDASTFSARGWCDHAVDVAVRRLQGIGLRMDVVPVDVAPFKGDLKIALRIPEEGNTPQCLRALLRLHEEGDGSCLWQVKCNDENLGVKVKDLMR
ncbi:hypothetical protein DFH11DRAFT_82507 [Phellopilus nigrolimitatus]|nr:hypothetical protein DFH11DRAFT_82507 [Phellopilus nigrolimitatus]